MSNKNGKLNRRWNKCEIRCAIYIFMSLNAASCIAKSERGWRMKDEKIDVKSRQCELRRKRKKEWNRAIKEKPIQTKTNWYVCSCVCALNRSDNSFSPFLSLSFSDSFDNNIIDANTFFCGVWLITFSSNTEIYARTKHMQSWMLKLIYPLFYLFHFFSLSFFLHLYILNTPKWIAHYGICYGIDATKIQNVKQPVCMFVYSICRHDNAITIEQQLRMYFLCMCISYV